MTEVFASIAYPTRKSSKPFGDLALKSHPLLSSRQSRVVSAICGWPVEILSVIETLLRLISLHVTPAFPSQVKLFSLDTQQLIQSSENALIAIQVSEDDGDVVNGVRRLVDLSPRLSENLLPDIC